MGTLFYSTVYAYNADNIPGDKPAAMADFFDLDRFPGRRGMRRTPQVNLEFALIADGVPPGRGVRHAGYRRRGSASVPEARHNQGPDRVVGGRRPASLRCSPTAKCS